MTQLEEGDRCAYCRRPLALSPGPGRPRRYCRRSHRQRAYEARRRADRARLAPGQVVVNQADLDRLHDRLYALEAALDDITADLDGVGASGAAAGPDGARATAYADALAHLAAAAGDLRGLVVDPVTA